MAGYYIYSLDADVFHELTTAPTLEQALVLADGIVENLEDAIDEFEDTDPKKWPLERAPLAKAIRKRLAAADWYADLTMGDAAIWDDMLRLLMDEPGEELGVDFRCDNDGFLAFDTAAEAAGFGAAMMAEPAFGGNGFRYSGKSKGDLELIYTMYLPPQTQQLLKQLEKVSPQFVQKPKDEWGARVQFFEGLVKPVRRIIEAGRVMWVSTDT